MPVQVRLPLLEELGITKYTHLFHMAKPRKYTDEEFIHAVKTSYSVAQVLTKLGLKVAGGNYSLAVKRMQALGVQFAEGANGKGWRKGKNFGPKRPLSDYLSNKFPAQSHKLKCRLLNEGIKEHKCENCGITEWNNKPTPIELDHINGNNSDNSLENLRLLCPNCHAQTPTYRGKNVGRCPAGRGTRLENERG